MSDEKPRWYSVAGWRHLTRKGKVALRPFREMVERLEKRGVRVMSFDPGVQFADASGRTYDMGKAEWEFLDGLLKELAQ